jgi:hypothetical protein
MWIMAFGWAHSRITALLAGGAALLGFASLRFARSVLVDMLARSGPQGAEASQLTVFALAITGPAAFVAALVVCLSAIVTAEIVVKDRESRLLVHVAVLLLLVLLLSIALAGLFMPFHVPDIRIP